MQAGNRVRRWMLASAIAVAAPLAAALAAMPAAAESGVEPPAARVTPVLEPRCLPRRTCWYDHWGYRRCFRSWVCDRDIEPRARSRAPARRRSRLEDDYAPESGFDREPPRWRYEGRVDPEAPQVVRPGRRGAPVRPAPPQATKRQQVTKRPRVTDVPDDKPATGPKPDTEDKPATGPKPDADDKQATLPKPDAENKPATLPKPDAEDKPVTGPKPDADDTAKSKPRAEPEIVVRREEPSAPEADRAPEANVEVIPRPTPAPADPPKQESARLKEAPPAPERPRSDDPASIAPAPPAEVKLVKPETASKPEKADKPEKAGKPADKAPAKRQVKRLPDDIDSLPRGRKIPMDEIEPPKPKKKLPERLRI